MSQLDLAVQKAMQVLRALRDSPQTASSWYAIDMHDVVDAIDSLSAIEDNMRLFDGVPAEFRFAWRYGDTIAYSRAPHPIPGAMFALRYPNGKLRHNAIARVEHISKLEFICERAV